MANASLNHFADKTLLRHVALLLLGARDEHIAYLHGYRKHFSSILLLYPKGSALQQLSGRIVLAADPGSDSAEIAVAKCPDVSAISIYRNHSYMRDKRYEQQLVNSYAHKCLALLLLEFAGKASADGRSATSPTLHLPLVQHLAGLLFMHSDFWFSPHICQMLQMDLTKLWRPRHGLRGHRGQMMTKRCLKGGNLWEDGIRTGGWNWDRAEKLHALRLLARAGRAGDAFGWPAEMLCYGWSDMMYIPRQIWETFAQLLTHLATVRLEISAATTQSILVRGGLVKEEVLLCLGCCNCHLQDPRQLESFLCGHRLPFLDPRMRAAVDRVLSPSYRQSVMFNPGQALIHQFDAVLKFASMTAPVGKQGWGPNHGLLLNDSGEQLLPPRTESGEKLEFGQLPVEATLTGWAIAAWLQTSSFQLGPEMLAIVVGMVGRVAHNRVLLSALMHGVRSKTEVMLGFAAGTGESGIEQEKYEIDSPILPELLGFPVELRPVETSCLLSRIVEEYPWSWRNLQSQFATSDGVALLDVLSFGSTYELLSDTKSNPFRSSSTHRHQQQNLSICSFTDQGGADCPDGHVVIPSMPADVIWHVRWLLISLQLIQPFEDKSFPDESAASSAEWWLESNASQIGSFGVPEGASKGAPSSKLAGWNVLEVGPGLPLLAIAMMLLFPDLGSYSLVDLEPVLHMQFWCMAAAGGLSRTVFVPSESSPEQLLPSYDLFLSMHTFGQLTPAEKERLVEVFIRRSKRGVILDQTESLRWGRSSGEPEKNEADGVGTDVPGKDLEWQLKRIGFQTRVVPASTALGCSRSHRDPMASDVLIVFVRALE